MKYLILLLVLWMLVLPFNADATPTEQPNVSVSEIDFEQHTYLFFHYNDVAMGVTHDPDCTNKIHPENLLRNQLKEKEKEVPKLEV